jgi:Zn ribbon nucleic-acid-binding protein
MDRVTSDTKCPQCGFLEAVEDFDLNSKEWSVDCRRCGYHASWKHESLFSDGHVEKGVETVHFSAGVSWAKKPSGGGTLTCLGENEIEEAAGKIRNGIASGELSPESYVTRFSFETKEVTAVVGQIPTHHNPHDQNPAASGRRRVVKNADNEFLLPSPFGCVDEVNGPGGEECKEYIPTRHELLQLAKYWFGVWLGDMWFTFSYDTIGSTELRRMPFAERRFDRVADIIGEPAFEEVIKQVEEEFRKARGIDDRTWNVFKNGDSEQRKALKDEWDRQEGEQDFIATLQRFEDLRKASPTATIVLVLSKWGETKWDYVLFSPTDSELHAVLRNKTGLSIDSDMSKLKGLMVDQHCSPVGFLRSLAGNDDWPFEFLDELGTPKPTDIRRILTQRVEQGSPSDTTGEAHHG